MKKIVFLHVSSILGGSERSFLDLVEKATAHDRKQFLVIVPDEGPLLSELKKRAPEVSWNILPLPAFFQRGTRKLPITTLFLTVISSPGILFYLYRLKNRIRQFQPDLIYVNGLKCLLLSLVLKRIQRIPVVWHLQDYFPALDYVKTFLSLIGTQPELIICNSDSVSRELKKIIPGTWSTTITTAHNSVNLDQFQFTERSADHPIVISMVGMITPWKGQNIFIDAIHWLVARNPSLAFRAQIVGGEAYATHGEVGFKKQLEDKVQQLNLTEKIFFTGLIVDIETIYKTSDIVTHCSIKPEPFGRVIIEAMASGCAVIATRAGGVTEIISDGQDGFLVTPGSAEELGQALEKLILDANLRKSFTSRARKTVEDRFSATHFSKTIFSQLERISP